MHLIPSPALGTPPPAVWLLPRPILWSPCFCKLPAGNPLDLRDELPQHHLEVTNEALLYRENPTGVTRFNIDLNEPLAGWVNQGWVLVIGVTRRKTTAGYQQHISLTHVVISNFLTVISPITPSASACTSGKALLPR